MAGVGGEGFARELAWPAATSKARSSDSTYSAPRSTTVYSSTSALTNVWVTNSHNNTVTGFPAG